MSLILKLILAAALTLAFVHANASNDAVFAISLPTSPGSGGTAFLIEHNGEQTLVSNRHVCAASSTGLFLANNGKERVAAIVTNVAESDDLCLLRLYKTVDAQAIPIAKHQPQVGSIISTQGYPRLFNQVRSTGLILAYEAQVGAYQPKHIVVMGKTTFRGIPGMSGSPVFDFHGDVIGVLARRALYDGENSLFVTLDRLKVFLAETETVALSLRDQIRIVAKQKAIKYNVDHRVILAIIETESSFNPNAIGRDGELGLMQVRPEFHACADIEIVKNIECGTKFLHQLRERFEPEFGDAWVVFYNWGPNSGLRYPHKTEYYRRVARALEAL
jgi:S1-C subfamily serine protease